jgi:hypothetical protein
MGFHKRIIHRELVERTEEGRLNNLLNADALEMDKWSYKFFELFKTGKSKQECIEIINGEPISDLPYPQYSLNVLREEMKERLNK